MISSEIWLTPWKYNRVLSERQTLIFLPSPKDTGQLSVLQERASVSSDNPWLLFDLIIVLLKSQSFPPHDNGGLLHSRVLVWSPPPQVALQAVKLVHSPQPPSTGQHPVLQELWKNSVSSDNPWLLVDWIIVLLETQSSPPHDIDGLLHSRVLVWFPPPQVALQAVKLVHSLQPPLTIEKIQIYRLTYQIIFISIRVIHISSHITWTASGIARLTLSCSRSWPSKITCSSRRAGTFTTWTACTRVGPPRITCHLSRLRTTPTCVRTATPATPSGEFTFL